ncbi:MAG: nucleotide sugar dehydrogenase [Ilumatobacteraceae bacterium]
MARIAIVGTGYVGLTTGACFAHLGHEVICADVDAAKVDRLSRGEIPIVEHGLDRLVEEGLRSGRLRFVVGAANAVTDCDIAFLCVPTPQSADGSADLSYIEQAAREIAPVMPYESVVVNKSTVPVGSARVVERVLDRPDIKVVSNPEFLREGSAVQDFLKPDRIVVGSTDQAAAIKVSSLYLGVAAPVIVTDPASAETIKYAANAFLATKLSFVNAVAAICEGVGADVNDVVLGLGYDKRIGQDFLRPGPGWGGSCFRGDETLLVRDVHGVRLIRFDQLQREMERAARWGLEALSWSPDGAPAPEFQRVLVATARPYIGEVTTVRTTMGRRLTITADHPMIVRRSGAEPIVLTSGELTTEDWLPIALGNAVLPPVALIATSSRRDPYMGRIRLDSWDDPRPETDPAQLSVDDAVWSANDDTRQAVLRRIWSRHGTWSVREPDRSVVLELGAAPRQFADSIARLLGSFGVLADVERDPTTGSHRLSISGADEVEGALWLLEPEARKVVAQSLARQSKRIAPTGYRPDGKGTAWVRVVDVERTHAELTVYSAEVERTHTIVTSFGLVAHNCFPKDTRALLKIATDAGYEFDLLDGVVAVNDEQFERVTGKIRDAAGGDLAGKCIGVWGLTFKARTDDLRESPSLSIIDRLLSDGATVRAHDPTVDGPKSGVPAEVEVCADAYAACEGADVLAVLTEWDDYRWLDASKVAAAMRGAAVVDARNLLDRSEWRRAGFEYLGIGR